MTRPKEWNPQDWIIVVEALAHWVDPPEETEVRQERAYELIEEIAELQGLPAWDLVNQQ